MAMSTDMTTSEPIITDQPMVDSPPTEYRTLQSCLSKMVHSFSQDPNGTAVSLFQKRFVSEEILRQTQQLNETTTEKGNRLAQHLLAVVEHEPEAYEQILQVVDDDLHQALDETFLATALDHCDCTGSSERQSSPASTQSSGVWSLPEDCCIHFTCGCGNCPFFDYANGTVQCPSTQNPYVKVLSANEAREFAEPTIPYRVFISAIEDGGRKMHFAFCVLLSDTFTILQQSVPFSEVKQLVNALLRPTGKHFSQLFKLMPQEKSLESVGEYEDLQSFLQDNYCSWYNYELISYLRKYFIYPQPHADEKLQLYEKTFQDFVKHHLFVYLDDLAPRPPTDKTCVTTVTFKVDIELDDITFEQIRHLELELYKCLSEIPRHTITLKSVRKGCTELTFQVPACFKHITTLTDEQIQILQENEGIELTIDGRMIWRKASALSNFTDHVLLNERRTHSGQNITHESREQDEEYGSSMSMNHLQSTGFSSEGQEDSLGHQPGGPGICSQNPTLPATEVTPDRLVSTQPMRTGQFSAFAEDIDEQDSPPDTPANESMRNKLEAEAKAFEKYCLVCRAIKGKHEAFKDLITEVAEALSEEDIERIIWFYELPNRHYTGLDVLEYLYSHGKLSEDNLDSLEKLLEKIHRRDLIAKLLDPFRRKFPETSSGTTDSLTCLPMVDRGAGDSGICLHEEPTMVVTPYRLVSTQPMRTGQFSAFAEDIDEQDSPPDTPANESMRNKLEAEAKAFENISDWNAEIQTILPTRKERGIKVTSLLPLGKPDSVATQDRKTMMRSLAKLILTDATGEDRDKAYNWLIVEVAEHLTEQDIQTINFVYELPNRHCTGFYVLQYLHSHGKLSEDNPDSLEELLEMIHRRDLITKLLDSFRRKFPDATAKESPHHAVRKAYLKRTPYKMSRPIDPVFDFDAAYFRPFRSRQICRYKASTRRWSTLPTCPVYSASLVFLNEANGSRNLYTVGGETEEEVCTNVIYRFNGTEWVEADFPCMKVARKQATVVSYRNCLIVAGGRGERGPADDVEVLDQTTKKWKTVARVPHKMFRASGCVCSDHFYLLGGNDMHKTEKRPSTKAYRASLDDLVNNNPDVFKQIADIQLPSCAFVSVSNRIVAIGGSEMRHGELVSSNSIFEYDPEDDVWKKRQETLSIPRSYPFAIVIYAEPRLKVMVVGGNTPRHDSAPTDEIEYIDLP